MNKRILGFSLIELLVYIAILAVVIGFIVTMFITTTKIGSRETSSTEVTSQIGYVSQTIQRLVRESSNVDIPESINTSTLKLRTSSSSTDPTCIYLSSGTIKISQGAFPTSSENCTSTSTNLTNSKVVVDNLIFTKLTSYPGHDSVAFEIQISLNTSSTENRSTKVLKSSIARVSAATFDSSLLPGSANSYDVGQSGSYWRKIILGDGSAGSPAFSFNNDLDMGLFRGGTDILGFSTAGVQRMVVDSFGNVGIGVASPASKLDVSGDINVSGSITASSVNTAPSGSWCGLCGDGASIQTCLGVNVCSSCPSGWTQRGWSTLYGSTSTMDYVCMKN